MNQLGLQPCCVLYAHVLGLAFGIDFLLLVLLLVFLLLGASKIVSSTLHNSGRCQLHSCCLEAPPGDVGAFLHTHCEQFLESEPANNIYRSQEQQVGPGFSPLDCSGLNLQI